MTAADTNVLVAAFASWHEHNAIAAAAVSGGLRLVSHVAVETYAVLTRLPPPHRAHPSHVIQFLERHFPDPPLALPPAALATFLEGLPAHGISGGASYDALVGETARLAGEELLTLDRRAMRVYEAIGARSRLLA